MAFEIRQRKEEMLQVDYRFFKRRNQFRSPMSREAAYTGCPGWYGKGQLRDVRGVPGPEDNA